MTMHHQLTLQHWHAVTSGAAQSPENASQYFGVLNIDVEITQTRSKKANNPKCDPTFSPLEEVLAPTDSSPDP